MDPSDRPAEVLVTRAIPTDPAVRSSESLFLTESGSQDGTPSRKLLFTGSAPAPAGVARLFRVEEGAELLARRRLMSVDGVPVRLAVSWFSLDGPEASELAAGGWIEGGLQQLFDRHGRRFGKADETLVGRLPSTEESGLLEIDRSEPVVEILRTSYDTSGRPVHSLQTICAAGRHVFVVRQLPGDSSF